MITLLGWILLVAMAAMFVPWLCGVIAGLGMSAIFIAAMIMDGLWNAIWGRKK